MTTGVTPSEISLSAGVALSLALSLGGVFAASSVAKLRKPRAFASVVAGYALVPAAAAPLVAALVIGTELFLACALLTGVLLDAALWVAAAVLLVFGAAVAVNLRRGRHVTCGCFGSTEERLSPRSLLRIGLLGIAVLVVSLQRHPNIAVPDLLSVGSAGFEYLVAAAAVTCFFVMAAAWVLNSPEVLAAIRAAAARRVSGESG
jgi:uncharacterized membrane protein YphA (DoxX/SURF4 family)